ncbi:mycothione reductase [Streptomyces virginiae]|uniref:mycothione reductase n=1 Tax=Streptomyces virginiae TaxID=1961 RepID=UPI003AF3741F
MHPRHPPPRPAPPLLPHASLTGQLPALGWCRFEGGTTGLHAPRRGQRRVPVARTGRRSGSPTSARRWDATASPNSANRGKQPRRRPLGNSLAVPSADQWTGGPHYEALRGAPRCSAMVSRRRGTFPGMRTHDLVIVGAGSGNAIVDDRFSHLDVAIVDEGLFGGTCLNRGCIPSKMLVHVADVADGVRDAGSLGVEATLRGVRWADVRARVFGRLDQEAAEGEEGRRGSPNVHVYKGHARFTEARTLLVGAGEGAVRIRGEQVVVAAGSRPTVPEPVAESGLPYETSDTIMRRDAPPRHLAVLGGGYVAAELAHVFHAAGSRVTVIEQEDTLLPAQDETVAAAYTEIAADRYDVRTGTALTRVEGAPGRLVLVLDDGTTVEADTLLVAVGRIPNGDRIQADRAGIALRNDGRIVVDAFQRTTATGVFALGDVCTPFPLKHVANREARVVAHNLLHADDLVRTVHEAVPAAVFTRPQIAQVGRTEGECRMEGLDYTVAVRRFSDSAYGWALEDGTGFCKVLADRRTGLLLGAHIIGPQAATLIQPLVVAMSLGIDATTLARTPYWIHPAATEAVSNALLDLDLDSRTP